jgi:hypothetical protein
LGVGLGVGFGVGLGAGLVVDGDAVVVDGAGTVVVVSPGTGSTGTEEGSGTDVVPWAAEGVAEVFFPKEIPPQAVSTSAPASTDAVIAARVPVFLRSIESLSLAGRPLSAGDTLSAMVTHLGVIRLSPAPNRDPADSR